MKWERNTRVSIFPKKLNINSFCRNIIVNIEQNLSSMRDFTSVALKFIKNTIKKELA